MTQLFNTIKAILVALLNFLKKNHVFIIYFCFFLAILCCLLFIIYQNNEIIELNKSIERLNDLNLDSKKKGCSPTYLERVAILIIIDCIFSFFNDKKLTIIDYILSFFNGKN